ncbi:DNA polymerase subunit B [uncultured Caudovirales phage]|uniref:DNA-directed DNA polymerase n=1 Tax=uncultured Caudovirales phage TaxID=2100421 RepID=A0A6J5PUG0_9CAUD|nr:DNA polymerase subunit B [uncultured Caudovirales phage]CAB4193826.1 DNA polymerase subunit B [uncultured Caudovirales phage]
MEDKSKHIKKLDLKQNAIKILINSIYGAFGNKWFYFYNPDIAQSITLQGQDLIKFSIKAVNHYFLERWHLDTELHEQLGISKYQINKVDDEAAIYTDTDSIYVQFDSALESIIGADFTKDEMLNICINIDRYRLSSYFDSCFERYGKLFNTKNRLKFKLENLSETGIWLKKKNYAIRVAYEPNPNYELEPQDKRYLIIKGLEPVKGSYPIWARNKLTELTSFVMDRGKRLDLEKDIIPRLTALKAEALSLHPDDLAFNFRIRVYNKYVASEAKLELRKGISIFPRAAAIYNHTLITTGLIEKYPKIREGDKIKFYYCNPATNEGGHDVFAYSPGTYPDEIAILMDIDSQFFSLIIEPINRLLTAMKISSLDSNLKRAVELITVKSKKVLTDAEIFPLYVVDQESLEYIEVPEKFWKVIGNPDADIPEEDFQEYLGVITKYGLNTTIVPKPELDKYLKRLAKKKEKSNPIIELEEENV